MKKTIHIDPLHSQLFWDTALNTGESSQVMLVISFLCIEEEKKQKKGSYFLPKVSASFLSLFFSSNGNFS